MTKTVSQVIYISENEEISTVIHKIFESGFSKIFLVIPQRALLLQSPINLRILKEFAEEKKLELIVVTTDYAGLSLCSKLGLKCCQSILNKEPEETGRKIFIKKPEIIISGKMNLKKKRGIRPVLNLFRIKISIPFFLGKAAYASVFLLIFAISAAAFVFLPNANIFISANPSYFEKEAEIFLNPAAADISETELPCRILEIRENIDKNFNATGEKIIERYAEGEAEFFNERDSSQQNFLAGTRLISQDGKIFKLKTSVSVPGFSRSNGEDVSGKARAAIIADEPGPDFNIGSSKFFVENLKENEKYDKIYLKSDKPMSGGILKKEITVSKDDIENASRQILSLIENSSDSLQPDFDEILIKESIKEQILSMEFNVKEGQASQTFNVKALASKKALAVKKDFIKIFFENSERASGEDIKNIEIASFKGDYSGGKAQIKFSGESEESISAEGIKKVLLGKSEFEARKILGELGSVKSISMRFWPFWSNKIPANQEKVNIFIDKNNYFSIIN